jgi:hypothetical protein
MGPQGHNKLRASLDAAGLASGSSSAMGGDKYGGAIIFPEVKESDDEVSYVSIRLAEDEYKPVAAILNALDQYIYHVDPDIKLSDQENEGLPELLPLSITDREVVFFDLNHAHSK